MFHSTFPDSPEAVALALLFVILDRDPGSNITPRAHVLALYAECLAMVRLGDCDAWTRH